MALQTIRYKRVFVYEKAGQDIILPDINPSELPDKVPFLYMAQYPELINATVKGPELKGEEAVYTIETEAGTKG